jgi:hypothetical protein
LFRNVAVRDHSQLYPHPEYPSRGERGIDVRGQVHLHNIEIANVKPSAHGRGGAIGVKFRNRGPNGGKGSSADWSTLENFFVSRLSAPPGETRGGGVKVHDAIAGRVYVSNGNVVDLDAPPKEDLGLPKPQVSVISRSVVGERTILTWAEARHLLAAVPSKLFLRRWRWRLVRKPLNNGRPGSV